MYQHAEADGGEWTARDWEQEFARRMALAGPEDTARGVFCNGLLRVMRELGGEALELRCRAASGEEQFLDFFNYPITTYLRMVSAVLELLAEKHGGAEEALRQLGRRAVRDMGRSAAGKALGMMNTGEARTKLEGLRVVYQIAVSFGATELVNTGPTSARLTLKRVFMPLAFHEGVLLGSLVARGVRGCQVRGRQVGPLSNEYEISWE